MVGVVQEGVINISENDTRVCIMTTEHIICYKGCS